MGIKALIAGDTKFQPSTQNLGIFPASLYGSAYRGGALNKDIVFGMLEFTGQLESYAGIQAHESEDEFWGKSFDPEEEITWPTVMTTGWFDIFQQDGLDVFETYRKNSKWPVSGLHRLILDPLGHCGLHGFTGGSTVNATSLQLVTAVSGLTQFLQYKSFEHYADGSALGWAAALAKWGLVTAVVPRYVWTVQGSSGGHLTAGSEWPAATPTDVFLAKDGRLAAARPSYATAAYRGYDYDPTNPVHTKGGFQFWSPDLACGPVDTTERPARQDVLTFDGEALNAPLAITGRVKATLTVTSSAKDTDFIVKLVDVFPRNETTGESQRMLVCDGVVRMRWRAGANGGARTPQPPMSPGEEYEIEVDMWSASYIFGAGHSIGVDVTSSSFPAYLPNPNNGLPIAAGGPNVTAANRVLLGESRVTLPKVAVSDLPYWNPPLPEMTGALLRRMEATDGAGLDGDLDRLFDV